MPKNNFPSQNKIQNPFFSVKSLMSGNYLLTSFFFVQTLPKVQTSQFCHFYGATPETLKYKC